MFLPELDWFWSDFPGNFSFWYHWHSLCYLQCWSLYISRNENRNSKLDTFPWLCVNQVLLLSDYRWLWWHPVLFQALLFWTFLIILFRSHVTESTHNNGFVCFKFCISYTWWETLNIRADISLYTFSSVISLNLICALFTHIFALILIFWFLIYCISNSYCTLFLAL